MKFKNLSQSDYKDILKFYKTDATKMDKAAMKAAAEHLIATKLCKCIKNIPFYSGKGKSKEARASTSKEARAIAICTNSVVQKKNLKTFRFSCKKGPRLLPKKGNKTQRKILIVKKA